MKEKGGITAFSAIFESKVESNEWTEKEMEMEYSQQKIFKMTIKSISVHKNFIKILLRPIKRRQETCQEKQSSRGSPISYTLFDIFIASYDFEEQWDTIVTVFQKFFLLIPKLWKKNNDVSDHQNTRQANLPFLTF